MEKSIFAFVFRHSLRQQIFVLVITLASLPFYYYTLDLPKVIVNQAISGRDFPVDFWGFQLDQIAYLLALCGVFLALVMINGGFKYFLNVYRGKLGERLLRRMRYELFTRVLRFPLPHFKKVSSGEIIPMVTSEVEPLGGFMGDALSLPVYQGGLLLVALGFMFVQDWMLGLAAIALYPVQGYVIPKLQRQVNRLGKERVRTIRSLADKVGETITGIPEVRANDAANVARADMASRLGRIFDIRYEIFRRKFFIKFLNNFIGQLTPFFFYSIGGYLVIQGSLSFGALVAVLAAYKDLQPPWKELLRYYQTKEDARIKYEQVVIQFAPDGMLDESLQDPHAADPQPLTGTVCAGGVAYAEDDTRLLQGVSFEFDMGEHVAVVGAGGSGKDELALLLARLILPTGGVLTLGGQDVRNLPEAVTGRRLAYVGPNTHLFSASLRDNLIYGLRHRPLAGDAADADLAAWQAEARRTGNLDFDLRADWTDYAAAGCADACELSARIQHLLEAVGLDGDVYALGLRGTVDPDAHPEIAERLLAARREMRSRLDADGSGRLVEPFDRDLFNRNATVAENLLFGVPVDASYDLETLGDHPHVRRILDQCDLTRTFVDWGRQVAATMVELFADLPPGHEFFETYSFIRFDDIPETRALLSRIDRVGLEGVSEEERCRLLNLPFKLIPARHRLGVIDAAAAERIVAARHKFMAELPEEDRDRIAFFDPDRYNPAASLQDNILFGKIAEDQAGAESEVARLLHDIVASLELRPAVLSVGLEFQVGIGGTRLSAAQRQKAALVRALLKNPDLLVINGATAALDGATQTRVLDAVLAERQGRGVVWALHRAAPARHFQRILVLDRGSLVAQGTWDEVNTPDGPFAELLAAD